MHIKREHYSYMKCKYPIMMIAFKFSLSVFMIVFAEVGIETPLCFPFGVATLLHIFGCV